MKFTKNLLLGMFLTKFDAENDSTEYRIQPTIYSRVYDSFQALF